MFTSLNRKANGNDKQNLMKELNKVLRHNPCDDSRV